MSINQGNVYEVYSRLLAFQSNDGVVADGSGLLAVGFDTAKQTAITAHSTNVRRANMVGGTMRSLLSQKSEKFKVILKALTVALICNFLNPCQ